MLVSQPEIEVAVVERIVRASGVVEFELAPCAGALPGWEPGAHITVRTPAGVTREYSLLGSPAAQTWRIAVLRQDEGRGGSVSMHDEVVVGAQLVVSGPANHFAFVPNDSCTFIAGGIGITPILPMLAAAQAAGTDWSLTYVGRNRESMAFADDLTAKYGERVQCVAVQESGRPDLEQLVAARSGTVYCCGPQSMVDQLTALAHDRDDLQLRTERFEAAEVDTSQDTGFELVLDRSGISVDVGPEESIVDALDRVGVGVLSSCREGTCGTCETVVLTGEIEHRDVVLTEEEREAGDLMMVCVSRAACPRLVLDL